MMAWGPAFDKSLTEQGERAVFAPTSACPPMLGVDNSVKAICPAQNLAVKNYLLAHPEIKTVLMSAYWSTYFREGGPLTAQTGNPPAKGLDAAKNALASTIQWLRDNGRLVVLVGPVPVYDKSVPLALALEQVTGRKVMRTTMDAQRQKNAAFFAVVDSAKRGGGAFRFLDPIQWLCAEDCMIMKNGVPMYRDSNHLNVAGAMTLEADLNREMIQAPPSMQSLLRIKTASSPRPISVISY